MSTLRNASVQLILLGLAVGCGAEQPTASAPVPNDVETEDAAEAKAPSAADPVPAPSSADNPFEVVPKGADGGPATADGGQADGPDGANGKPPPTPETPPTLAEYLTALPKSAIAYNRPKQVPYGKPFDVELFIDPAGNPITVEHALDQRRAANPLISGDTAKAMVPTGDEVRVELFAVNADVDPLAPTGQVLSVGVEAHWRWRVTPRSWDPVTLDLTISAVPAGRSSGIPVESYHDTIVVEITSTQRAGAWVAGNWEWAWTFVAGPLFGVIWARLRSRRRREEAQG